MEGGRLIEGKLIKKLSTLTRKLVFFLSKKVRVKELGPGGVKGSGAYSSGALKTQLKKTSSRRKSLT